MLPLIPIAITLLPELAKWLFGSKGEETAKVVAGVVATVTGTSDPAEAAAALADPVKAADLRLKLAEIAAKAEADADTAKLETFKAALADTANARAQTISLASVNSKIAWGAPIVSVVVTLGFFAILILTMQGASKEWTPNVAASLNIMLGVLSTAFIGCVGYWTGSNAGSAAKTQLLANSVPASLITSGSIISSGKPSPKDVTADDLNDESLKKDGN